jgi:hypothetical protein
VAENYKAEAKRELGEAVIGWKLVHYLWKMENTSGSDTLFSHRVRALVDSYAPGRVEQDPNNIDQIFYKQTVRTLMSVASEHFQKGRTAVISDI